MATSGSITAPQDSGCLLIFLVAVPSYPLTISGAFLGASLGQGNGRHECRGERGWLAAWELVSAPLDSGWNSREALAIVSLAKFAVPPHLCPVVGDVFPPGNSFHQREGAFSRKPWKHEARLIWGPGGVAAMAAIFGAESPVLDGLASCMSARTPAQLTETSLPQSSLKTEHGVGI